MDPSRAKKLEDQGVVTTLPSGQRAIGVSFQLRGPVGGRSRSERGEILRNEFAELARRLRPRGVMVNLDSISVSGQTCEALVPFDVFDEVLGEIEEEQIRTDLLSVRQVV